MVRNKKTRWTTGQVKFLKENHNNITVAEIAKILGRTETSVTQKIFYTNREANKPKRVYRQWTTDEEEKLLKMHKTMEVADIVKKTKRSERSIRSKIAILQAREREVLINKTKEKVQPKEQTEYDAMVEKAYQKLINEKVIAGVFKKDIKVKIGQSYKITRNTGRILKEEWEEFYGKVIHETRDHFTLKNKHRAETFLKVDFLIGDYKMKEVN